jgi:hypothetical protein
MIDICDFARKSGASYCHWKLEADEPLVMPEDQAHHNVMMYYNPLETSAGKAVLCKWRSTGVLWDKAKAREDQLGEYSIVVVARDDDYWIGPYYLNPMDFIDNPFLTRVIPCLESHGINDKAVIMGRRSADALLTTYADWKGELGDELMGTRNAEEFWFKKALASGLTLVPSAMPMAVASFTSSGIPSSGSRTSTSPPTEATSSATARATSTNRLPSSSTSSTATNSSRSISTRCRAGR